MIAATVVPRLRPVTSDLAVFLGAQNDPLLAKAQLGLRMNPMPDQTVAEAHYEADCAPEQLTHVLSALDRWSGRTAKHVNHLRSNDRHNYRTTVIIEPSESTLSAQRYIRQVFHVPTRNVSKAGLGFVAPPVFRPKMLSDATPLVRSESIFRVGAKIRVKLGSPDGKMPTLCAEITRLRPVHFGFFDIGVRFIAREP